MTITRFVAVGVALLVLGGALAGCADGPASPSSSAVLPTGSSTTSTPMASASSASPMPSASFGPEEAAVRKLIGVTLYETQDAVASDYSIKLDALHQVMIGDLVNERLDLYLKYRDSGYKQTGHITAEVRSVATAKSVFTVRACVDGSQSDVLDKAGKSVVWSGSPKKVLHEFQVISDRGAYKATSDKSVSATC
jgi:hypothetical protein